MLSKSVRGRSPLQVPDVASKYILAFVGKSDGKIHQIISADHDWEYLNHFPNADEYRRFIKRGDLPHPPSLQNVWNIQHGLEAELARR